MGTDNLFHKRRAKSDKALKRRKAKRESYNYVLIVCEGGKTEPLYLRAMIKDLRLNTANVEVCGDECGSSPKSVVEFAQNKQKQQKKLNDPFDKIFCVFDKDSHASFESSLKTIQKSKNITAITSVPCFEFWLLLHFTYTDKPYAATGDKSICEAVIDDLKVFIPNYSKAEKSIYEETKPNLQAAISSSKAILASAERNNTDNPTTNIHELVEYLRSLKENRATNSVD